MEMPKLLSTNFLLDLKRRFDFPVVIIRLYLVYGPNQDIKQSNPNYYFKCHEKQRNLIVQMELN